MISDLSPGCLISLPAPYQFSWGGPATEPSYLSPHHHRGRPAGGFRLLASFLCLILDLFRPFHFPVSLCFTLRLFIWNSYIWLLYIIGNSSIGYVFIHNYFLLLNSLLYHWTMNTFLLKDFQFKSYLSILISIYVEVFSSPSLSIHMKFMKKLSFLLATCHRIFLKFLSIQTIAFDYRILFHLHIRLL